MDLSNMSITLPLSLSQLTWVSEEASPANSRWAFALLQVTGEETNLRLPRHQAKNRINSFSPSVGTIQSFLQKIKKKSKMMTGDQRHPSSREGEWSKSWLPHGRSKLRRSRSSLVRGDFM
jgi:hypothetical protein